MNEERFTALALATVIKNGLSGVDCTHFYVLESEVGPFPDDLEMFASDYMAQQGRDLEHFHSLGPVLIKAYEFNNEKGVRDRVLLVVCCQPKSE